METMTMLKNNSIDVNKLKPSYIRLFLEKCGWEEIVFKNKKRFDVYQKKKDGELYQINVPIFDNLSDYEDMIVEACNEIAFFEGLEFDDVVSKICNPQADIIKIRTNNPEVFDGSIPFDTAINLFENSKKVIADAAMDVSNKMTYRTARYGKDVERFISKCRFGQTKRGSYVISIICPFDNVDENGREQLTLISEPAVKMENYTRQVVKKLFSSIKKISSAIENNRDLSDLLKQDSDDFVSLNFMEDLGNLGVSDRDGFVEIKAELDPTLKEEAPLQAVVFESNKKTKLVNFVETYKQKELDDQKTDTFYGYISKTKSEPILQQRVDGEITIKEQSTGLNYRVVLQNKDYDRALVAHKNGKLVKIVGIKQNDRIINPIFTLADKQNDKN